MTLAAKLRRAPLRLTTGAFILNSGMEKLTSTDEDQAKRIHGVASGAFPQFERVEPKLFFKALGAGETALGAALLLPVFPAGVVGAALMGFSGSLLTVYWRTPGMHEEGSIRPTAQGIALAKDSWMFGAGSALVVDALLQGAADRRRSAADGLSAAATAGAVSAGSAMRTWFRRAKVVAADTTVHAVEAAKQAKAEHGPEVVAALSTVGAAVADRASQAAVTARESAKHAVEEHGPAVTAALSSAGTAVADRAASVADAARDEYGSQAGGALTKVRETLADKAEQLRDVAAEKADELGKVAAEKAAQAREVAAEKAVHVRELAADKAEHARELAADKAEDLRDAASDKGDELSKRAAAKAVKARVIAVEKAEHARRAAAEATAEATAKARASAAEQAAKAREAAAEQADKLRLHG